MLAAVVLCSDRRRSLAAALLLGVLWAAWRPVAAAASLSRQDDPVMTFDASIAVCGPERIDDVRELWLELHRHHKRVSALQPLVEDDAISWQRRRNLYLRRLVHGAGFLVLAEGGREVVGYAAVFIEDGPDDTFALGERFAELYSLSVAPRARGNGVGTRILDVVERELAARGVTDLKTAVMVGNDDARRFYERRGMRAAETVLYRFGRTSDRAR